MIKSSHRNRGALLFAVASAGLTSPAEARTVEYLTDLTAIRTAAEDQGIPGPFSDAPGPGTAAIVLETPAAADHQVIVASVYCQAYHIENPVSTLLQDLVVAANLPSTLPDKERQPAVSVRVLSGSTLLRCMNKDDIQTACKNRVRITAEASVIQSDGTVVTKPLIAQVERTGRVGGFCGNIARYTGIVTREAGIELIRQAQLAAGDNREPQVPGTSFE